MLMAEVGKSWTITKSVQRSKGINTQGVERKLSARGCMRCRDSTKYAQERMYRGVAEALQSIQLGPSDTRSQSYRLLAKLSSLIY
jgi:hypothetical protein